MVQFSDGDFVFNFKDSKMNILEIYRKYQIMPQLEEHMLRVAGVADVILENLILAPALSERERGEVVLACLLHDIGNIVKFDFSVFPETTVEKGLEYWQKIKAETIEKYGADSHTATHNMLKEFGVLERVLELVDSIGFSQAKENMESQDFAKKICAYADMRVLPRGVGSLEERMQDLRVRYKNHPEGAHNREVFEQSLREIEKQIFMHCKLRLEEITEEKIKEKIEQLKNWEI